MTENVFRVTEDERKAVRKLYNRTEEEIKEDIKQMKEWINKQPHLPQDDGDEWLKVMLFFNKFSLEKTKKKLDLYYSIKHIVPEYFLDRNPLHPSMQHLFKDNIVFPLPKLNNLVRTYFMRFTGDGKTFITTDLNKLFFSIFDFRILHDCCAGESFIIDFEGISFNHMTRVSPVQLKHNSDITQKTYSVKIMSIDFINVSSFGASLVNIILSVLSEKIRKKVRIHKSVKDLLKFYSPEVLPNELGGTAGALDDLYDNWLKYFESKNDFVKETGLRRTDESKRIGEPLDSDMFGMCGSFRKLTVD